MNYVFTVFLKIVTMLLYAVPAFLLVKTRLVKESAIAAFSTVLMYVLNPRSRSRPFRRSKRIRRN